MKDDRTYIKLHDGMPENPKITGLSDAGFRAIIDLWCWCSRNLTDGQVSTPVWRKRVTLKVRRELLGSGLVHETPDGVEMHDYLQHQRSAAEVAAMKAKRAAAGSKGGKATANRAASATARAKQKPQQVVKQTSSKSAAETEGLLRNPQTETETPSGATAPTADGMTARDVVAAWVDSIRATGTEPTSSMTGQAAKCAKELLDKGNDPRRVIAAAQAAGTAGYATIDRQLASMNGRPLTVVQGRPVNTGPPRIDQWRDR